MKTKSSDAGGILKRLNQDSLLIMADDAEERGLSDTDWDTGPWCYLRWARPDQVAVLSERIKCRKILLPCNIPMTGRRQQSRKFTATFYDNSKGELCRPVTAFALPTLTHILGRLLGDAAVIKYVVPLRGTLSEYEPFVAGLMAWGSKYHDHKE